MRCDEGLSIPLPPNFLSTTVSTLFLRCLDCKGLYLKKNNSNQYLASDLMGSRGGSAKCMRYFTGYLVDGESGIGIF